MARQALAERRYARLRPCCPCASSNATIRELLGRAYLSLGWNWMAAVSFEAILARYPLDDYAHHLGRAYEAMGPSWTMSARHHYRLACVLASGHTTSCGAS